jgi:integrase
MMKRLKHWHEKKFTGKNGQTWTAYYHVVKVDGKVKWTSLGNNKSAALRKWAEIEAKPVPSEAGTFDSVANEYMKWAEAEVANGELAQRTYDDREKYLKAMRPVFGQHPLEAIRSSHVVKYIDKRSSKHTAGQEMRFLSVLWNWAKARDIVTSANPVQGVKLPGTGTRKIEVRPQDYWLVWGCGDQMVKDVMELAARLGTRPQEVFGLTWGKVDLIAQPLTVKVWQNKVAGYRLVVADAELEALIQRLRGDRDNPRGHVLTDEDGGPLNPVGAFRYRFGLARSAAIKKAEEADVDHQDFQLRDLRPMAGLAMLDAEGMDAARRLLGHTTERMTAAYTTKRRGFVSDAAPIKKQEVADAARETPDQA